LDLDDPETTALRQRLIQEKPFLRQIYQEWYAMLAQWLPVPDRGPALEVGAGGGFARQVIPRMLASEVFFLPGLDLAANGLALPFPGQVLRGILLTNVFHHISRPSQFLREAIRCLQPGGILGMVEPWVSRPWSMFVYTHLHHEPFDPQASQWDFPPGGPLSAANGALPWIIFQRDRARFQAEFPELELVQLQPFMPFRYLLSGGVSLRSLAPGWSFKFWKCCETPFNTQAALFALIVLRRREG
jgi:SAM-dependent methyltransferase